MKFLQDLGEEFKISEKKIHEVIQTHFNLIKTNEDNLGFLYEILIREVLGDFLKELKIGSLLSKEQLEKIVQYNNVKVFETKSGSYFLRNCVAQIDYDGVLRDNTGNVYTIEVKIGKPTKVLTSIGNQISFGDNYIPKYKGTILFASPKKPEKSKKINSLRTQFQGKFGFIETNFDRIRLEKVISHYQKQSINFN